MKKARKSYIPALKLTFGERISIRLAYRRMTPAEQEIFLRDAGYAID